MNIEETEKYINSLEFSYNIGCRSLSMSEAIRVIKDIKKSYEKEINRNTNRII